MSRILLAAAFVTAAGAASAQTASEMQTNIESCLYEAEDGKEISTCLYFSSDACSQLPGGSSTRGQVACYTAEMQAWDGLLNEFYRQLKTHASANDDYGVGPVPRATALRDAQRSWIAFRDADCVYASALWGDGSMRAVAGAECLLKRTAERVVTLIGVLNAQSEGN